ncbi:glycosyltransferase family 4 protein [Macrococcus capreoli]|uniref:glycosyltransferase family 4 protein n=1 Tax=Macrococcus capreoli TaxID=2982690 RepID=UPI003F440CF9
MNILFVTLLDLEDLNQKGIYHDFVNELKSKGNNVTVVCPSEKRFKGETKFIKSRDVDILKVKIGDITKTSKIKKGINTLLIERQYKKNIRKYLSDKKFDLIIYTTPPITFNNLVKYLKETYHAKSYLLLKDIFPQNAVDLNMFKKNGLIYKLFRNKEIKLYNVTDYIGAMSQENINYIKKHNNINSKMHVFRNAIYEEKFNNDKSEEIKDKYNIDKNKKLLLYGGNLGIPQGIDYIKNLMKRFDEIENAQLMIVGSGTHYSELEDFAKKLDDTNIIIHNHLPKEEYDQLVSACDIGLIFLDNRFTIPNYPSRLTTLLCAGKPILAATDKNTDIKDDILNNKIGLWNESNNVDAFINNANKLINSDLKVYGENSRRLFEREFKIEENVNNLFEIITQ